MAHKTVVVNSLVRNVDCRNTRQTTTMKHLTVPAVTVPILHIIEPVPSGVKKDIVALKVRENISFREVRRRVSPFHSATFADATRRGATSHRPAAPARATSSDPAVVPTAPTAAAASAVSPPKKISQPALGHVASKASPQEVKPPRRTARSLERLSTASEEAMDMSSSHTARHAPMERRDSVGRSKKDKTPITGPRKGPSS